MGHIDYKAIYAQNKHDWYAMTEEPQKYEALLAGHYSDSNHFVYELLQNAEDEHASRVVIIYHKDRLTFYHNGDPFDEADVRGVSSMLMGTKNRNDAQTIGRFGMGFKSVFKYTCEPEIYSDEEAFRITNYLLPVEIEEGWNYTKRKTEMSFPDGGKGNYYPFLDSDHLTRIVIPFKKRDESGRIVPIDGTEVLLKLKGLDGEILLFLTHIKNLYWINQQSGEHEHIILTKQENDDNLVTCRIYGSHENGKESISRYLKYRMIFNHPKMKFAEVSVAYRMNQLGKNINSVDDSPVWVYFPTRDKTELPFLIHGSFETAVSREKLMTPSSFNDDLKEKLGELIAYSMKDLAARSLITMAFLRTILLPAFKDEEENETIPGLKDKVDKVFSENKLLPTVDGLYGGIQEVSVPVPFEMNSLRKKELFKDAFEGAGAFVVLNNEREKNFNEYYSWLIDDLGVRSFTLQDFVIGINNHPIDSVAPYGADFDDLKALYDLLYRYRESTYRDNFGDRFGAFDWAIRGCLPEAWDLLRHTPIILNADGELVQAWKDKTEQVYLTTSNKYRTLSKNAVVNARIGANEKYVTLLRDGFQLTEFNNFQFVKEKVIKKYVVGNEKDNSIGFEDEEHFEIEYVEDINQIFNLIDESGNIQAVKEMLERAYIIKIDKDDNQDTFGLPGQVYVDSSDEGIDLRTFYSPVQYVEETFSVGNNYRILYKYKDTNRVYNFGVFPVDTAFFEGHGISIEKLKKLGLVTSPVVLGERSDHSGVGDGYWDALGDFCPRLWIPGLDENLKYITAHPDVLISKKKSNEILKLLLKISHKLVGKVRKRQRNPYETTEKDTMLFNIINKIPWLYTTAGTLSTPNQLSKFELDRDVYTDLPDNKEAFTCLGFIEKESDTKATTFEMVDSLDHRDKEIMFRQLAKELHYDVDSLSQSISENYESNDTFDTTAWQTEEFPRSRVKNINALIEHVRKEFFCADPTKYEKVLRQIRTSNGDKTYRAYAMGMYTNESGIRVCQICKKMTSNPQVVEIANFGIEMPQLHICLCPNCAAKYKLIRDRNKVQFKNDITESIQNIDIEEDSDAYEIEIENDISLFFTQTHLAEVKEILKLIKQNGLPNSQEEQEKEKANAKQSMEAAENASRQLRQLREQKQQLEVQLNNALEDLRKERSSNHNQSNDKTQSNAGENKRFSGSMSNNSRAKEVKSNMSGHSVYVLDNRNTHNNKETSNISRPTEVQRFNNGNSEAWKTIRIGDTVSHISYGNGKVIYKLNEYITVSFKGIGTKKFKLPMAFTNGYLRMI